MNHKPVVTNGHTNHVGLGGYNNKGDHEKQPRSLMIPILTQNDGGSPSRLRANGSDSSNESIPTPETPNAGDISAASAFSGSSSTSHSSLRNVYSMSPRSTSFMYQYYSTAKGYYQQQVPFERTESNGSCNNDDNSGTRLRTRSFVRTTSDCCQGSPPRRRTVLSGVPQSLQKDIMEDPRRRVYSESDKHSKGSMHASRMSALAKFRKKLGRSGSGRKKKEHESHNNMISRTDSREREEDGEKHNKSRSPSSSKRDTKHEEHPHHHNSVSRQHEDRLKNRVAEKNVSNVSPRNGVKSPSVEAAPVDPEPELIYQRFLEEHTCYDIMPTSCKLVVFDTRLQARQAFHALISNAARSAPLWDSKSSCYVGVLTVTDFIKIILTSHRSANMKVEQLEEQTIESWRKLLQLKPAFASVCPHNTLLHALNMLMNEHVHGIPIIEEASGDIFHVVDHKRILRFLHLFMNELPMPSFMKKTIGEARIGSYEGVSTVTGNDTMLDVLRLIVDQGVSAVPVIDDQGDVKDVFCKLDMIPLAAQGLYHDLSMTLEIALAYRFTPIVEDEISAMDERITSPLLQRRGFLQHRSKDPRGPHDDLDIGKARKANGLTESTNDGVSFKKDRYSSLKGHNVVNPKQQHTAGYNHTSRGGHRATSPSPRHRSTSPDTLTSPESGAHKIRHKSLSNPLVKCRLTDTLQYVIDLMVKSDANLLVVVGQSDNHVIGVVTVSDVLWFMINPQDGSSSPSSQRLSSRKKRTGQFCTSMSSGTPLAPVQDDVEAELEVSVDGVMPTSIEKMCSGDRFSSRKPLSNSSLTSDTTSHTFNDSGYVSNSSRHELNLPEIKAKTLYHGSSVNDGFRQRGETMERA